MGWPAPRSHAFDAWGMEERPGFQLAIQMIAEHALYDALHLTLLARRQPQTRHRFPLGRLQQSQDFERAERHAPLGVARAGGAERAAQLGAEAVRFGADRCLEI